jgi:pimeloyl-ACP methyl ester carboxylesterase
MDVSDDDLSRFAAQGAPSLPAAETGAVAHDGARIWYAVSGAGAPVVLLHGGLGHSGNWGHQVPALLAAGYRVLLIDSRGHGRSTRDDRPYAYVQMAGDVLAVMDTVEMSRASLVGWSDGADVALVLAAQAPARAAGVFFFACNVDPAGAKTEPDFSPALQNCFARHQQDYAQLSATPRQFAAFAEAVGQMQRSQPNFSAVDLAQIHTPVTVAQGEHDEFIHREHAEYLARSIPGARFVLLPGVSHFAPLQRPGLFNAALLDFLTRIRAGERAGV